VFKSPSLSNASGWLRAFKSPYINSCRVNSNTKKTKTFKLICKAAFEHDLSRADEARGTVVLAAPWRRATMRLGVVGRAPQSSSANVAHVKTSEKRVFCEATRRGMRRSKTGIDNWKRKQFKSATVCCLKSSV